MSSLIDQALEDVHNGLSQRAAAKKYGVPQSTISDRIRGVPTLREVKIPRQRLSPAQESFICKWILDEEKAGRAPNRRQVAEFATSILKGGGGDNDKLGARWVDRFIKRNHEVRTKISSPLESARARGSTNEAFTTFFDLLDDPDAIVNDDALPAQPSPPRTPPRIEVSKDNYIFKTPQKSRDMLDMLEGIHDELSTLNRNIRTICTKAAKSLDVKNAELAAKDHRIQYLEAQLELHKPRSKRKIREGGNDDILKARDASKEAPKRRKVSSTKNTINPVQQVERALETTLQVIHEHQNE